ncbi:methyltransferase domain-containing protein [Natrononativus amylolyticus]|uniref:methyltransferase domain-containing protein n=1 Tax=Natrononativus amylolyticus TaxID=2963434 RepID=UPI0020CBDFCD|nr:methyltransferase domain-containing protein [Natrononativus amylolyticus]
MTDRPLEPETLLALRAARETGALEALMTTADTPAELAAEAGITRRSAEVLVAILEAEGFLERVRATRGETTVYEPTNRALGFLAKTDVRSIGPVPAALDRLDRGLELAETLRTGESRPSTDLEERHRLAAAATADEAAVRAVVTAACRFAPDADRVLEVGGAPGRHAVEFAARGRPVTLADRPSRLAASESVLAGAPVSRLEVPGEGPVTTVPADADGPDLVVSIDRTVRNAPGENEALLESAFDALEPGGWTVVVDRVAGHSAGASRAAAAALLETPAGRAYDESTYREWFRTAGFESVRLEAIPGTDRQAIGGRTPEPTG